MSANEFLSYLALGGAIVALSWLLEFVPAWGNWHPGQVKQLAFFAMAAAVALAAWGLQTYTPALVESLSTPFQVVAGIFALIYLGEQAHEYNPLRRAPDG